MILTITANPSVDISYQLEKFNIDDVTRTSDIEKHAGGKGIHVGYVLKELGAAPVHSGFVGGKLGEFIEEDLEKRGQKTRFVKVKGDTRNCIAILHEGKQTEILEAGPTISIDEKEEFINNLNQISEGCHIINISGSLPKGLTSDFYKQIIKYAKKHNKFVSIDTSGNTLKDIINSEEKPDLIKPNETEISYVLGRNIEKGDLKEILKEEPFKDIPYIVVSMGKDGAIVKIKNKIYNAKVPKVLAINPVGSGDSSLAGALFAIDKEKSDEEIIKTSMTCGLLNVLTEEIAHIEIEKFDKYFNEIEVEEV
ncbi:MAG: hexose kinase [Anaerococcus vaginalis]|uniref:hexose kinase n=1 Tax=Anaerococcus vaginalis TaxID=33037 RepID=UPI00290D8A90|nr:hexose kinase [Anaerococcus vaginalis]MDU6182518.1 hexose kinase [Anaerococcus vaginalis]MDU7433383.1 hexose kinase [Anaerococcus vaginalis]